MDEIDDNPDKFTEGEIDSILSDEDLRERSQALHDAQERWEKLSYVSVKKIPCRECGGSGQVAGGGFGDICVACMGTRLEVAPDADDFEMPDFARMRAALTAYGDALADRALPDPMVLAQVRHRLRQEHDLGHHDGLVGPKSGRCTATMDGQRCPFGERAGGPQVGQAVRRGLALPPASTVPTVAQIKGLHAEADRKIKALGSGGPGVVPPSQLPAPRKAKGLAGEGDLGEYSDAEMDEMISDAEET